MPDFVVNSSSANTTNGDEPRKAKLDKSVAPAALLNSSFLVKGLSDTIRKLCPVLPNVFTENEYAFMKRQSKNKIEEIVETPILNYSPLSFYVVFWIFILILIVIIISIIIIIIF
mmetsp:Transcript_162/g.239  ORF Transcript_162/g.239 Transcript_162/m.239 type:complete len:115 (+) Transcript_162:581-925(+)